MNSSLCSHPVDHPDSRTRELVHPLEEVYAFGEGVAVGDEAFGAEGARGDHAQEHIVTVGLDAVAAVDFQLAGDDEIHGDRGMVLVAQHEADLHVPPPLGEAGHRVEAGLQAAEGVHGYLGAAAGRVRAGRRRRS